MILNPLFLGGPTILILSANRAPSRSTFKVQCVGCGAGAGRDGQWVWGAVHTHGRCWGIGGGAVHGWGGRERDCRMGIVGRGKGLSERLKETACSVVFDVCCLYEVM